MTKVKIVNSLPHNSWINFVETASSGNIFHTPMIMDVFRDTINYEPYIFSAFDEESEKIKSLMLVTKVKIFEHFFNKFITRMISYGGIINAANDENSLASLLENYDKLFKNKCLFTEIRNIDSTNMFKQDMIAAGYRFDNYLNYILDLKRDVNQIFKSFSESRRRNIRTLEKMGANVEEAVNAEDIEIVYAILDETYSRIQVPLADISLFESLMKHLLKHNLVKFLFVKYKDKTIATLVALLYKRVIYTWYYGSTCEFHKFSPESLLIWHIIKWGALNGYSCVDFGGAGRPDENYAVREYKARFKGQCVNYGRYIKVYSQTRLKLSKFGYQLYRKFL